MSAVYTTHRRSHTRPHAHRPARALQRTTRAEPNSLVDDELADEAPWLTVYADEQELGSVEELLMEPTVPRQAPEHGHGLGW